MFKLIRLSVFMVAMLFALAQAMRHHGAQAVAGDVAPGAAPADAHVEEVAQASGGGAYNPWGRTQQDPVTRRAVEPKVLVRDASGQFHVHVLVNGHDLRFLVDTGADLVALTPGAASELGLHLSDTDYRPVLRTASGTGMGAPVYLDSIEITGRRLTHQRAVVAQGLDENLLGQSVLRNLGRVELAGDTMVLHPN